jgi:hypothetical protein
MSITPIPSISVYTADVPALRLEVERLRSETARLTEGLTFYANRDHYELPNWEEPDEPGWLCPFDPHNDMPWMVEDGRVARAILAGGRMGMRYGESCMVMPDASAEMLASLDPPKALPHVDRYEEYAAGAATNASPWRASTPFPITMLDDEMSGTKWSFWNWLRGAR